MFRVMRLQTRPTGIVRMSLDLTPGGGGIVFFHGRLDGKNGEIRERDHTQNTNFSHEVGSTEEKDIGVGM